jgi:ABC-2 type transport system permease protein
MITVMAQAASLAGRDLRSLVRQPFHIFVVLAQPVIWLLLFGALFSPVMARATGIVSYIGFLSPGVVAVTALSTSGWSGVAFVSDIHRGILNRLLVTPAARGALIMGPLAYQAMMAIVQGVVVLLIGFAAGVRYRGGIGFLAALLICTAFLAIAFSSLSNVVGLITRRQELVVLVAQLLVLPLTFLSQALVPRTLMPGWMAAAAPFSPVDWLIQIGRSALGNPQWDIVLSRGASLLALAACCAWLSALAFRIYQRVA